MCNDSDVKFWKAVMNLHLDNQIAVVLGGAGGIGRAIAQRFLEERCRVVLVDRVDAVNDVARELGSQIQGETRSYVIDVTTFEQVVAMLDDVATQWGPLDHLVVAVGAGSGKFGDPFWSLSPADWPAIVEQNLMSVVHAAHAAVPHMIARRRGTMLFISSVAGQIGSTTDPPYSAAKAAVINFGQCAARDLARYNVRVNLLAPGMVKTRLNQLTHQAWQQRDPARASVSYEDWAAEKIARVSPLGRWQTPEDMADLTVFLASDRAMNITGQTLNVDGGQVMHA